MTRQIGPQGNAIVSKYLVSSDASEGYFTTIAEALLIASSGDTIVVKDGSYTEDLTLKAGVNIVAFSGQASDGNVEIIGKLTATFSGQATISGIRLTTNSDYIIAITGSNPTIINCRDCDLNVTNNQGITVTSSGNPKLSILYCTGDISGSSLKFIDQDDGTFRMRHSTILNSGATPTASTFDDTDYNIKFSTISFPITSGGTAGGGVENSDMQADFSAGGSSQEYLLNSFLAGQLAVPTGCIAYNSVIQTSSTAISGIGTVNMSGLTFQNNRDVTATTQTTSWMELGKWTAIGQPSFLAYLPSTDSNVTGNGTAYTLGTNTQFTEVFDQNSDLNVTGAVTFTAPVTGKYLLELKINCTGFGASSADCFFQIVTSNRTYESNLGTFVNSTRLCNMSVIADMDASDTATYVINSTGVGADNVDLIGASDMRTLVCGQLIS